MATIPEKWQLVSWAKKDEQRARIPTEWLLKESPSHGVTTYLDVPRQCGLLSKEELRITEEYDATSLAEAIRSGSLKSVDVVRAFCKVHTLLRPGSSVEADKVTESSYRTAAHQLSHRDYVRSRIVSSG
jgi:hypothetical protein